MLLALLLFTFFTIQSSVDWFKQTLASLFNKKNSPEIEQPVQKVKAENINPQPETEQLEDNFKVIHPAKAEPINKPDDDVELTIEEHIQREEPIVKIKTPDPVEISQALVDELGAFDPTLDLRNYKYPPAELLEDHKSENSQVSNEELISNKNKIVETLGNYKIQIDKIKATIGPTVTLYEIVPAPGIRISRIKSLEDDIALSLSALGIRIIAPMPGKGTIGIEVPNLKPEIVSMRSLITSRKFQESTAEIAIAIGKTISNETFIFDLTKMPHLLVAGATGQGKSVGLNAILASILYKKHPSQIKFVLVDPKKVELTLYSKIERHFLAKLPDTEEAIITDTQKVINTLQSLTIEMENRYELLKNAQVRNIKEYNERFLARRLNPQLGHRYLPYIVVVIDEFADLIMTAGREIETPIARLAQLARAIGIHLIIATQRPTTNIITGVIKANFPARIAFRVSSMIDSRTILDSPGANQLIGRGDLLFAGGSDVIRLQCAFIDIPELERITDYIGNQQAYPTAHLLPEYSAEDGASGEAAEVDLRKRDEMFEEAARLVVMHQQGSTSLIQRKFSIGYNRAGRIMDQLEAAGIVGAFEGSKARQVLFVDEHSLEQFLNTLPKIKQ
ncbi:MAG: DNA translocase FtsK [Bacteroidales bacterium]|nr:DNA translocase FtsK [Bacteroidales bacterium]